MKIFAFNYTCERDKELSELMRDTLIKNAQPFITQIRHTFTDGMSYGNGSGWEASLLKLSGMHQMLKDYDIRDSDFILSVDSDVVFTSPLLFDVLDQRFGIIGTVHKQPFRTHYGDWGHCSGALIFIRGDIARKMCDISIRDLERIRIDHFKAYNITENEDVVLSYLAKMCGAEPMDLPSNLSSGNFEFDVTHDALKSFYHLNYCPTEFMGEKTEGKWDLPRILKLKGYEL